MFLFKYKYFCFINCIKRSKFRGKCKYKEPIEKVNATLIKSPYLLIREIEGFLNVIEKWNIVAKKKRYLSKEQILVFVNSQKKITLPNIKILASL